MKKIVDKFIKSGETHSARGFGLTGNEKLSTNLEKKKASSPNPRGAAPSSFLVDPYQNRPTTPASQTPSPSNSFGIPNLNDQKSPTPEPQPSAPYRLPPPGKLETSPCTGFDSPDCRGVPLR